MEFERCPDLRRLFCPCQGSLRQRTKVYHNSVGEEFDTNLEFEFPLEPYDFDLYEDDYPIGQHSSDVAPVNPIKYGQFLEIILYDHSVTVSTVKHKMGSVLVALKDIKMGERIDQFKSGHGKLSMQQKRAVYFRI